MRVEIPPSPNVRRHDDDDGFPAVALSGRGSRPAPAGSDPDLRTGEDQEDPKCQGWPTPTCGAKQPPRLRPDAAGGTGLRVVSSRVGQPNGNRVCRTGVQHRPSASRASGPTILDGESGKSGRWQATQQTDRHCCGRILTSRAHDPNRVAGQRKTGADFNSSVRGKPEA